METPVFPNADALTFSNDIRGMENPILFNVPTWPVSFLELTGRVKIWKEEAISLSPSSLLLL
jgi:hypothetical protein